MDDLKYFLVGGAVRDQVLKRENSDRDYVVVGANEEQMLERGFKKIGKSFPVFLHPDTGEEYALARTEKKQGLGHTGFEISASADITLLQDPYAYPFSVQVDKKLTVQEVMDLYYNVS